MDLTLNTVSTLLRHAVSRSGSRGWAPEAALDTMSSLAQPQVLSGLLRSLRTQSGTVAARAARSFEHPLGFDKIALIDSLPVFLLRAHVWWPAKLLRAPHVHDHRFGFASTIVRGGYEMQIFELDQAGAPMVEYREHLTATNAGWSLESVGITPLRKLSSIRLREGSSYAIAGSTLHRIIVPPGSLCVTLFLETEAQESMTHVFAEPGTPMPAMNPKRKLSSNDYLRLVDAALEALAD